MSDAALGQDQFQPVNRRAGYGDALEMALSAARKGWTLSAGQGALIVEHYEEKLAAARTVTDAMINKGWSLLQKRCSQDYEELLALVERYDFADALIAALTPEDA